jgi:hypothetical protein
MAEATKLEEYKRANSEKAGEVAKEAEGEKKTTTEKLEGLSMKTPSKDLAEKLEKNTERYPITASRRESDG